jgi:hypothetical protein
MMKIAAASNAYPQTNVVDPEEPQLNGRHGSGSGLFRASSADFFIDPPPPCCETEEGGERDSWS